MKVIKLGVDGSATELTIDGTRKLEELQHLVGGYVEKLSLTEKVDMLMNEEAKFPVDHKANRIAGRLLRHFDIQLIPGDYIAGDVVLVGHDGPEWVSVPASTVDTLAFVGFAVSQENQ